MSNVLIIGWAVAVAQGRGAIKCARKLRTWLGDLHIASTHSFPNAKPIIESVHAKSAMETGRRFDGPCRLNGNGIKRTR